MHLLGFRGLTAQTFMRRRTNIKRDIAIKKPRRGGV
jgi:hypothetical protein